MDNHTIRHLQIETRYTSQELLTAKEINFVLGRISSTLMFSQEFSFCEYE